MKSPQGMSTQDQHSIDQCSFKNENATSIHLAATASLRMMVECFSLK
jgi:hypothetical protein